jgi:hypothetical protein
MPTMSSPPTRRWTRGIAAAALAVFLTAGGCDSTAPQNTGAGGAGGAPSGTGGASGAPSGTGGASGAPSGTGGASGAPATGGPVTDPGTGGLRAGLQANGSITYVRNK